MFVCKQVLSITTYAKTLDQAYQEILPGTTMNPVYSCFCWFNAALFQWVVRGPTTVPQGLLIYVQSDFKSQLLNQLGLVYGGSLEVRGRRVVIEGDNIPPFPRRPTWTRKRRAWFPKLWRGKQWKTSTNVYEDDSCWPGSSRTWSFTVLGLSRSSSKKDGVSAAGGTGILFRFLGSGETGLRSCSWEYYAEICCCWSFRLQLILLKTQTQNMQRREKTLRLWLFIKIC